MGRFAAQEALQITPTVGGTQLAQRLGLDLPDSLTRDREPFADLFERAVGVLVDRKAHPQDLLLARGQCRQHLAGVGRSRTGSGIGLGLAQIT
jgi:hypothetical protein